MASTNAARAGLGSAWFLTTCALLLASIGLVLRGREMEPLEGALPEVRGPVIELGPQQPVLPVGRQPLVDADAAAEPLEILAAFWGDDWPRVRAELEEHGLLPDELPEIRPWVEVSESHAWCLNPTSDVKGDLYYRTLMAWPGAEFDDTADLVSASYAKATPKSLAKYLQVPELANLDDQQVFELEERMAETNAELDGLIRSFMDGIGEAVSYEFRMGAIERAPLTFLESEQYTEDQGFYGHTAQAGGWASRVQLTESEYPDLAVMRRQILDMRSRRTGEVRAIVRELLHP
ncbi:MAG: hypothetical protein P1V81_12105 [Planctomycetota bacterium]|nr:hypothetical protein [Planctomycetota bacterium]